MNFENIRRKAVEEWNTLWHGKKQLILIGSATCGRSSGALETLGVFRQKINRRNIDCNIIEVGCFGLCYAEPLMEKGGEQSGK